MVKKILSTERMNINQKDKIEKEFSVCKDSLYFWDKDNLIAMSKNKGIEIQ